MIAFEPVQRVFAELRGERQKFLGVLFGGGSGHVVFDRVALDAAGVEIGRVLFASVAQDHGQRRQRAKVLEILFGPKAGGMEQDGAELQRCVVRDPELPVGGNFALSIREVTLDDGQQPGDFLRAGLMRTQPAVFLPVVQAHARPRSQRAAAR